MKKSLWTFCARHIAGWSLHRIPMRVLWCFTPVTTMTHSWVSFSYLSFGNFLSPKLLDEIMRVNLGLGRDCGSVGIVVTSDTTQWSAVWIQSLAKFYIEHLLWTVHWKDENEEKERPRMANFTQQNSILSWWVGAQGPKNIFCINFMLC